MNKRYAHSLFYIVLFKETSFNSVDGAQMIEKSEKLVKMSIPDGLLQCSECDKTFNFVITV